MTKTRKRYSADFKAKVALEAIRGDLTLSVLGARHGIHHTMIAAWKRQAIDGMTPTFAGASDVARANGEAEIDKLQSRIGQLVVERDPGSSPGQAAGADAGDRCGVPRHGLGR